MTKTRSALAHGLPRLRAHAAVLVGSPTTADSCLWIVLEAVEANPSLLDVDVPGSERSTHLSLLRILHRTTRRVLDLLRAWPSGEDPLARLSADERQALVLIDIERLSMAEAAFVMERDSLAVRRSLERAHRRLRYGDALDCTEGWADDDAPIQWQRGAQA